MDVRALRYGHPIRDRDCVSSRNRVLMAFAEMSKDGEAPTYADVAARCGMVKSQIWYHVRKLKDDGLLDSEYYKKRSVRVTSAGHALLRELSG
jgi:Mn-dependent DtxR family transcriptional regulator